VNHFGRIDITASKNFTVGKDTLDVTAGFRRLDSDKNVWLRGGSLSTPVVYHYPNRYQIQLGLRYAF
jgi:hypothetical protein